MKCMQGQQKTPSLGAGGPRLEPEVASLNVSGTWCPAYYRSPGTAGTTQEAAHRTRRSPFFPACLSSTPYWHKGNTRSSPVTAVKEGSVGGISR